MARLCVCFAPLESLFDPEWIMPEIFDVERRLKCMEPENFEQDCDPVLLEKLRQTLDISNPLDDCIADVHLIGTDKDEGVGFHSLVLKLAIPSLTCELTNGTNVIRIPEKRKTILNLRE